MTFRAVNPPADAADDDSVLAWLAANALDSETLPVDLSSHHDAYLYGSSRDASD